MALSASYDFSGGVVLVSGGASGIGAATARACAERGARVLVADVDEDGLAAIGRVPGIEAHRLDVADAGAVAALVAGLDRIDAAVLCAAIQRRTPVDEITDEAWRRHMAVNLDGVFHFVRAVVPLMRRQRSGAILAFTSGLVNMGWPGASAYASSKGALIGLIKCVAQELRPYAVRANVLSPGLVATPVFLNAASADEIAMYRDSVGISAPEDVVPSVLHLISDASKDLTGAVIERRLVPSR